MTRLKDLMRKQAEFQSLVGVKIDTNVASERDEIAYRFGAKMVEETVEMLREFPSILKNSSSAKFTDLDKIKKELSDVIFYIINFALVLKINPDEFIEKLEAVQEDNFRRKKMDLMKDLNQDILKVQNHVSGVGQGNLSPKYIFVGQNPGSEITHGYEFWSDSTSGSSQILLPVLDKLGIKEQCYFTNVVKSTTPNNEEPSDEEKNFWMEFLYKEIDILKANNPNAKIVCMGNWVDNVLPGDFKIKHPAYVLRGGITLQDYETEIQKALTPTN